jgi:hypothetical protein
LKHPGETSEVVRERPPDESGESAGTAPKVSLIEKRRS